MNSALPDSVYHLYGHVSPAEMQLLYDLASSVPRNGTIVEIGSFQGKSTVCLGLGAKVAGANVWAIDPHNEHQETAQTRYGMHNHAALLMNLVLHDVADTVRVVALPSDWVAVLWNFTIDLLWIDGAHEYQSVRSDLLNWSPYARKIAVHDSSGHFPGVTRAVKEFLMLNDAWKAIRTVDAITLLENTDV